MSIIYVPSPKNIKDMIDKIIKEKKYVKTSKKRSKKYR